MSGREIAIRWPPFYDGCFNRDGKFDVITFCDGGEPDTQPGVYDPKKTQRDPTQILLAVDAENGNGVRDFGEAVPVQSSELLPRRRPRRPALDDGAGYDPVKNPDPAGDDYHYLKTPAAPRATSATTVASPTPTARLDGVVGAGCEIDTGTPAALTTARQRQVRPIARLRPGWLQHDPHTLMTPDARSPMGAGTPARRFIYDAGIRDFFNAHVATSALFGELANPASCLVVMAPSQRCPVAHLRRRALRCRLRCLARHQPVCLCALRATEVSDAEAAMTGAMVATPAWRRR